MEKTWRRIIDWVKGRIPGVADNLVAALVVAVGGFLLIYFRSSIIPLFLQAADKLKRLFYAPTVFLWTLLVVTLLAVLSTTWLVAIALRNKKRKALWTLSSFPSDDSYESLCAEVRRFLLAGGFTVDGTSVPDITFMATNRPTSVPRQVAIMVEPNPQVKLSNSEVKCLLRALNKAGAGTGYYIARETRSFFSEKSILAIAGKRVLFTTYRDFVLKGIDFQPYLRHLVTDWENSKAGENYIDMLGRDATGGEPESLDVLLDRLLSCSDDSPRCIAVLGDFGSGKTTFLRHYAHTLARRHLLTPISEKIPVLVSLKEYELVHDLEKLVNNVLLHSGVFGSFSIISDSQLSGKVALMLDGLDEMTLAADRVSVQRNLQLIENIATRYDLVLMISCRTHFFRDSWEEDQLCSCIPVHIEPWRETQVRQYLEKTVGDDWGQALRLIKRTYNLEELSQTPLFLDMIVSSRSHLVGRHVTSAELYAAYTDNWIAAQVWKAVLDRDQKAEFMELLAWRMLTEGRRFVPWPQLRDIIQQRYGLTVVQVDRFDNDIRTCSFLTRQNPGYTFIHKSFLEFFVARYLAKEIESNYVEGLSKVELPYEVLKFIAETVDNLVCYERLQLWLEFRAEQQFALARRNSVRIMRIISRSSLPPQAQKERHRRSSELAGTVLSDQDTNTRWKAIVELGWLRSVENSTALHHILTHGEKDLRILRIATITLGLLGDTSAVPFIVGLLRTHEDWSIRQNCAISLGLFGDKVAIPDLIVGLHEETDYRVRRSIIWAIENIDPVMARDTLADAAATDTSEEVRQYAALAFGRVGGRMALDVLERLIKSDPSTAVRCSALETIGRIGGKEALPIAMSALNDLDQLVRRTAQYCVNLLEEK